MCPVLSATRDTSWSHRQYITPHLLSHSNHRFLSNQIVTRLKDRSRKMLPYVNRLRFVQSRAPLLQHMRFLCTQPASNSKLFIAGLSWSVDDRSLLDAFSFFGEVTEVTIIYDKNSGRSRGFGFVQFSNEEDAKYAKDVMDGKVLLGRPLRISYALERVRDAPIVVPHISLSEPKD